MKTVIFKNSVVGGLVWVCTLAVVFVLTLWGQCTPVDVDSEDAPRLELRAQSSGEGQDESAAPPEFARDPWIESAHDDDSSLLSTGDGAGPTALLAVSERRLQARQVLVPNAAWTRGHISRGAYNHPLARAPPLLTL